MRKIVCYILLLSLMLGLLGCGALPDGTQDIPTREFTDSAGRTVAVQEQIDRVAVTGQLAQIMVFAAAPDKMVGLASDWSTDAVQYIDEQYLELPVLGQLFGGSGELNLEELLNAAPQVIIDMGEKKDSISAEMDDIQNQTGIPTVHITIDLDNTREAFTMLGELLGVQSQTDALADFCDSAYTRTLDIMSQVGEDKVTALYCLGDLGCNVICRDSYHSVILDLLTENLAVVDTPSSKGTGNEVDMEQLYIWDPEVIFFAPNSMYPYAADDSEWQELTAIREGTYYEVPYGIYNWMGFPPSIQRFLGMLWMTEVLYPEYTEYDLYEEVSRFYDLFFHCEITQEQYEALVANSIGVQEEKE